MMSRTFLAVAAVGGLGLLAACNTQPPADTMAATGDTGEAACIKAVEAQSQSPGVTVVSNSNPGAASIITLEPTAGGLWSCYTNDAGEVTYVNEDESQGRR